MELIGSLEHSQLRVFILFQWWYLLQLVCFSPELSTTWLASRQQLEGLTGVLELSLSCSLVPLISSQVYSYTYFFCTQLPSVLLSHNLSLLHSCLLFSPPSQRVSLYCFRNFFPLNFDSSPVSLHPPFLKTLFSPFLCASHWCSSLLFPWCFFSICLLIRLTLSSVGFELTRSLFFSVFLGFTYAYRHSLLTSCLQITVGVSLSKLQSYQASWFIPAIWVTHFCTSSQCCVFIALIQQYIYK